MLQVIIRPVEKYSMSECAQMAIEAGAKWLQLSVPEMSDEELREIAAEIVPLCRESGVMLTIEDRIDMARELGLHGVFLLHDSTSTVKLRQDLGAEPIIGTIVTSADEALSLERADIDYVCLAPGFKDAGILIETVRNSGSNFPIVAYRPDTRLTAETIAALKATGFSGVCGGAHAFDSADPIASIEAAIKALSD